MSNSVNAKLEATISQIKSVVDVNTIIGQPIVVGEVTILPVSKVSYGFGSGGSDLPNKTNKELFAGGGGAGVYYHTSISARRGKGNPGTGYKGLVAIRNKR